MSLRLRLGDFVAVPISSVRVVTARLVARAGRVAVLAYRDDDGAQLTIRVLDAPMHERRWQFLGGHSQAAWPDVAPANTIVYDAGRAERAIAAFVRRQPFEEPFVWQICSGNEPPPGRFGHSSIVQSIGSTQRLSDEQLRGVASHADRLRIDARSPHLHELIAAGRMRDLSIVGAGGELDLGRMCFPTTLRHLTLSTLRVRGVAGLDEQRELLSLDIRHVELDASLACVPDVPMLAVRAVRGLTDARDLLSPMRTDVSITSQLQIRNLASLGDLGLAGVTLLDLPQLDRTAFSWLQSASQLNSLTLDIGARRIQSEIALPRPLPHATPLAVLREKSLRESSAGRSAGLAN
ncbi:MAG: hypothetical protein ACYDA1_05780 [Vulcanimicrobiaceae bacterium]